MPMAVFALISWLRNPYNGNKAEVKVNTISIIESVLMLVLASICDTRYISVVVCFVAFLVNDIYGYISWHKMQIRQNNNADNPYENSLFL